MQLKTLTTLIKERNSYLCVGLDTDPYKIPDTLKNADDPVFEFNKAIIDATAPYCVAYKPNTAFYEMQGQKGWAALEKTIDYIKKKGNFFIIADAKRGDIGNTAEAYARTFFEYLDCDAVTVAPYMGFDSVEPFLKYEHKHTILLAATSNPGAQDFQMLNVNGKPLWQQVVSKALQWSGTGQLMFVAGATRPDELAQLRQLAPDSFLLVPGVGKQGGNLAQVAQLGLTADGGLLVNASRSIIYAGQGPDFAKQAGTAAHKLQAQMAKTLL